MCALTPSIVLSCNTSEPGSTGQSHISCVGIDLLASWNRDAPHQSQSYIRDLVLLDREPEFAKGASDRIVLHIWSPTNGTLQFADFHS